MSQRIGPTRQGGPRSVHSGRPAAVYLRIRGRRPRAMTAPPETESPRPSENGARGSKSSSPNRNIADEQAWGKLRRRDLIKWAEADLASSTS